MNFIKDSVSEWRKITWPTRNQAVRLTIITVIFTIISTLILLASDLVFSKGYDLLVEVSPKVNGIETTIDNSGEGNVVDLSEGIVPDGLTITTEEGEEINPEIPTESIEITE